MHIAIYSRSEFTGLSQVNVKVVMDTLKNNASHAVKIILAAVPLIAEQDWTETIKEHQVRVDYENVVTLKLECIFISTLFRAALSLDTSIRTCSLSGHKTSL